MSTNPTFNSEELKFLLLTILKSRSVMYDSIEIKLDPKSTPKPGRHAPTWRGKRGTCPLLGDLDKALALMRLHINSDETIAMYDLMGSLDLPPLVKK